MINHVITLLRNKHHSDLPDPASEYGHSVGASYTTKSFVPVPVTGFPEELRRRLTPEDELSANVAARSVDEILRADLKLFRKLYPDPRVAYGTIPNTPPVTPVRLVGVSRWAYETNREGIREMLAGRSELLDGYRSDVSMYQMTSLFYALVLHLNDLMPKREKA